ncbi:prepilin peptidase [Ructibacterium gallinarum]|uniref:Prepilin peptidase n=1 Tax=Ructibacterium gallinarum TaxID=2779355 RepID=A0A9D5R983_9FIRM|nr:A24 family peptidase [Ructibacterium gallinarum]MBE5040752.1 prepilin peptidase [Ructibacterium gallinarum]
MLTILLLTAGYIDWRYRKIPLAMILLLLLYALLWSPVSFYERITGFFVGAIPAFCLAAATDKIKGGDVKFLTALGAAAGMTCFVQTLLFTTLYAVVYTMISEKKSVPLAFCVLLGWLTLKCVMVRV